jgi:hypothetical protein
VRLNADAIRAAVRGQRQRRIGERNGEAVAWGWAERERRMTRGTARLGKWVNGLADQVGVGPAH